jgi:predicted N-acetyltransferase YhbS
MPGSFRPYAGRVAAPATPILIRELRPDDSLAEITALLHRAYGRLAAMGLNYTAVDQSEEVTRERAGRGTCLVAVRDGRIVGTISCHPPDPASDAAWYRRPDVRILEQFAVEPDLQAQGLGRALMEAAEGAARREGAAYAVGGTAIPARHLIAMYAAWGYEEVETHQIPGKRYRTAVLAKRL